MLLYAKHYKKMETLLRHRMYVWPDYGDDSLHCWRNLFPLSIFRLLKLRARWFYLRR